MQQSRRQRVEAAVQDLRDYWDLGQTLAGKAGAKGSSRSRVVQDEANRRDTNEDYFYKAMKFASAYSKGEKDGLIRLIRSAQPGQDDKVPVFGRSHLLRLLSIDDKQRRAALQAEAVAGAWSTARLDAILGSWYGRRRRGGRRPRVPAAVGEALAQLDIMCEGWRRWRVALAHEAVGQVRAEDLPPTILKKLTLAGDAVDRLQVALAAERVRPEAGRTTRDANGPTPRKRRPRRR